MSFKQLENHSQLLCGRDFANERPLALPIWRLELITNNFKQNYLKQRDLAPLKLGPLLYGDFHQACWLVCLGTSLANQCSCPIQHVLFTTQLVVLGR